MLCLTKPQVSSPLYHPCQCRECMNRETEILVGPFVYQSFCLSSRNTGSTIKTEEHLKVRNMSNILLDKRGSPTTTSAYTGDDVRCVGDLTYVLFNVGFPPNYLRRYVRGLLRPFGCFNVVLKQCFVTIKTIELYETRARTSC